MMAAMALAQLLLLASCSPDHADAPALGESAPRDHDHAEHAGRDAVAYYTCSMHPSVKSADPGTCPICAMNLTPVTREEVDTGVIRIDAQRRQVIGVTTAPVEHRPLALSLRAAGKVLVDETQLHDVTLKYGGWIRTLYADQLGKPVTQGKPLFTLYSRELYSASQEYLSALASHRAAQDTSAPDRAAYLVDAARDRLRLFDLAPAQIERVERTGRPLEDIAILSPASGYIAEKYVVQGSAVEPGMKLFRIASFDTVWIEAQVYESELPSLAIGDAVEVEAPYLPGEVLRGRIAFIYPVLDAASRTGRVRVELPNPDRSLRPDMYVSVRIEKLLGMRLAVPDGAVLYAGERRFVFVDLGEGRLVPREVSVGESTGDSTEILSGVAEGDIVVTSGNFLVAAEARLKLAMEHWR
jgi:Cu(I)/Ag(I) efflux system membrane fusion protein